MSKSNADEIIDKLEKIVDALKLDRSILNRIVGIIGMMKDVNENDLPIL